jgi:RND family efflux transporter MFP subunit
MVVSDRVSLPELRFPGRVKAGESRDLSFEVPGRLLDIVAGKGQRVKKGDVLAKLDARDYEADVAKAEAAAERTELTLQRMRNAERTGGVSKEEVSKAETDVKTSSAQLAIARKALESCVIKAPYDGVVAETYPDSLDMVSVGQKILTLQNTDVVKFDVSIPETMVIDRRFVAELKGRRFFVVFDSLPKNEFDAKFEEFTSVADDRTQTFTATFSMPAREEFVILPGMSVTLVIEGGEKKKADCENKGIEFPFAVPTVAVGADETGAHFVWKLVKTDKEGEYKTVRQKVETGRLFGTNLAVKSGLASGDRIAVAGVTILTEGQVVTLYGE